MDMLLACNFEMKHLGKRRLFQKVKVPPLKFTGNCSSFLLNNPEALYIGTDPWISLTNNSRFSPKFRIYPSAENRAGKSKTLAPYGAVLFVAYKMHSTFHILSSRKRNNCFPVKKDFFSHKCVCFSFCRAEFHTLASSL